MANEVPERLPVTPTVLSTQDSSLRDRLRAHEAREYVFAVVGYAGSGTSKVALQLKTVLEGQELGVSLVKARKGLEAYAEAKNLPRKQEPSNIDLVEEFQNFGDSLRSDSGENAAVAAYMVRYIKQNRRDEGDPETPSAFILDSLKHPAEVALLRHVYGENFCLIGVGCRPDIRKKRLARKLNLDLERDGEILKRFMSRDAEDSEHKYGQQVNDTFHLSDYFVDNTPSDEEERSYVLPDKLKRLVDLLFASEIHRPEPDERGLYHAHAASLRSSCLSRQVGASIMDACGNLLAVGTNDVPKARGGLYGGGRDTGELDDRCFKLRKCCSNTAKQREIVGDIFDRLKDSGLIRANVGVEQFRESIKGSRLGSLIEFSRSVHAEMDALLSLVRDGTKLPSGASLYSTTYPCHNCARHIVASGVARVVYLEPYAKSLAIDLHDDSIADNEPADKVGERVQFLPYQGVSPRLYKKIFAKHGDYKDADGTLVGELPFRAGGGALLKKSYIELEDDVVSFIETFEGGGGVGNA